MRVSSNQYLSTMQLAMQTSNSALAELLQRMSSGDRLLAPSDDPIASVRLLRLQREEAALDQYQQNIGALSSALSKNESILDSISLDIRDAKDLLTAAANNPPVDDLKAMATPLRSLRESLFYSANTKDAEGRYMFSGSKPAVAALAYDAAQPAGSRYSFTGNTDKQQVVVGDGITQASNVTLENMADILNQLDKTIGRLEDPALDNKDPTVAADIRSAMNASDKALEGISSKIAQLGGTQNIMKTLALNHDNVSLSNKQTMTKLGSLDYADAFIQMNGYTMALQASQKAYGRVSQLSLFDVI
ncbi:MULTISPECIES: flagellar hook-associated protein FlgL [Chromobacterium]|uniref:Flagellar hook-associated protein 3 n=1 Tax=Chromobacterium rhizoryzae TaxID=1778675 RepID=A0AAD0RSV8_9NEIS|nr:MULTISPECIES: flagellar hook-associated protein FlgL [Chromobacterium]AXT47119.1 flagellar hook-associated protein 3 [Chromobacterium rhizoryzae]MCP1290526.1 flagellar hook-associated protein FlgL [Chromobacterium sp. S0633]PTU66113.1 flagellar hook-associated protein 3 [Chromobacterium sp. Panama]PTU70542.1 flagellar hook-associated protein 3 [Chromobacterium haemolyticum]UJB30206.1 flagellar hook-associated protein FlgL [Chromobacterium sp. Beijing]